MVEAAVNNKSSKANKQAPEQSPKDKTPRQLGKIIYVVVIVVLLAVAGYFFWQYQDLRNNPERAMEQEVTQLTNEIGRFMALPDETPTIATVEDASRLESQPFFDRAENGDKILIYTEARQAVIYRESERKIINVGPIALNASGNEQE